MDLPPPADGRPDLLVIAGEHSGDEHAGRMIQDLKLEQPGVKVAALGGRHLESAGAQLLMDLTHSSVVGVFEVLKSWSFFRQLFKQVMEWVRVHRPRAICLVDYPGLNLRLAQKLYREGLSKKGGGDIRLLYYISPQVWAWKARRRFDMARWLDSLGVIFPFEVEAFADTNLEVQFLGHPFLTDGYVNAMHHDPGGPVFLLPGSRRTATARIFPILLKAFEAHRLEHPEARAVSLYPSGGMRDLLESMIPQGCPIELRPSLEGGSAGSVLTSSGTMSLACALAGIPGAIAYRANPLTYILGRSLVEIPFLGIANLLLRKSMYPEYIQQAASVPSLAAELDECRGLERVERAGLDAKRLHDLLAGPTGLSLGRWIAKGISDSG